MPESTVFEIIEVFKTWFRRDISKIESISFEFSSDKNIWVVSFEMDIPLDPSHFWIHIDDSSHEITTFSYL